MVDVAQLVEHRIVAPVVVGSIPIVHPTIGEEQVDKRPHSRKLRGFMKSGR